MVFRYNTMSFQCYSVEKLYEKDAKLNREDVKILQEWLKKQPHLPHIEEMQILAILHACYYRIEPTKITIDNYFTLKTHHPEIFGILNEDEIRTVLSRTYINILPKYTSQGYGIMILKLLDFKVEHFNFINNIAAIVMISLLYLHQHGFVNGGIFVFDSQGFTFGHLTKFNISALKTILDFLQEGAPIRIKGVHFINVVPVLEKVKTIVKPLLKQELYNMLQFHGSFDTFYKYVPKDCLPKDYDGNLPSLQILQEENIKNILANYNFFKWHDLQKVDESKRLENSKSAFGVQGTFKKLEID